MKAWVLHSADDLRFASVKTPVPEDQEVLVRVMAAGICGSDLPRIFETGAHRHPLIPGHEFSGVVTETGTGVNTVRPGQRVGVFPLIPCGRCMPCREKHYEMCRDYDYIGSRRDGAFAEYVAVPVWNLLPLPETVTFEEAAMLEPMAVAVHAMRRACPSASDQVAVCGLGTIGLFLVMFLLEAGIENLLLIGNKDFQKEMVLRLGLSENVYCDSRKQDASEWIMEHTGGMGADVFFECTGRNETCALAVENTAPLGTVLAVGNPFSDMRLSRNVYWKILRNQLTVEGTWNSSFLHSPEDDWHYVLKRLAAEKIVPSELITHRLPLSDLEHGLRIMRDKTEDYVKIMSVG